MQSVRSMIWTRVAVSISHDDNHYTTGTSNYDRQQQLSIGVEVRIKMYVVIFRGRFTVDFEF